MSTSSIKAVRMPRLWAVVCINGGHIVYGTTSERKARRLVPSNIRCPEVEVRRTVRPVPCDAAYRYMNNNPYWIGDYTS